MASDAVDIATGLSISFTGLANLNNREILDFTLPPAMVEIINASKQSTTGGHFKIPADIKDVEPLVLVLHHWQDYDYFADIGTKAVVTITCPSGATIAFTGILQRYEPQQATLNGKMVAEATIEVSYDTSEGETITVTPAA